VVAAGTVLLLIAVVVGAAVISSASGPRPGFHRLTSTRAGGGCDPDPSTCLSSTPTVPPPSPTIASSLKATGLMWSGSPAGSGSVVSETPTGLFVASGTSLVRTAPGTGATIARTTLPGSVGALAATASSLWAAVSLRNYAGEWLLELDPATLPVRRTWPAAGSGLKVTGSTVWTAGSTLVGRNTTTGTVVHDIALLLSTRFVNVSSDPAATTLTVGSGDGDGNGLVTEVNASTGAVIATASLRGQNSVIVAGPLDGTVWVAIPGGMSGLVSRLNAASLRSGGPRCPEGGDGRPACTIGDSSVEVFAAAGVIWITQTASGPARNQCVAPAANMILASLPVTLAERIIAIGDASVFVHDQTTGTIRTLPIPTACRAG